jgi:protein TonB
MRKPNVTTFRILFLLILIVHVSTMFLRWQRDHREGTSPEVTKIIKVKFAPSERRPKQIVESEDPTEQTTPKENAYLSDKNRAFDRQTKARVVQKFNKANQGGNGSRGKPGKQLSLGALGGDIAAKNPFHKAAREYAMAKKSPAGGGGAGHGARTVSSTNDYIQDIPLGDLTHLNTTEYKYFGFYHRIKQKLEDFWGRSVQEKAQALAKQGRAIASEDQLVTALRIVMDGAGEIVEVVVLGSSGVKELDDAAVESFNQAGPFPNPPKDLIVDGRVVIEWGFVVNS